MYLQKAVVMDAAAIDRALMRMAHEIIEHEGDQAELALVGVRRGGVPLAQQLAENIVRVCGSKPLVGELDITRHRDDHVDRRRSTADASQMGFSTQGKTVVLVDDVLFTGRTIRAAMDALLEYGRPQVIRLAVLVDRGHRELPIRPDFVGKNIPTSHREKIEVRLPEYDGRKEVAILGQGE